MLKLSDKSGRSVRRSNFELLRIVAMLMIIAYHLCGHGGLKFDASVFSVNHLWTDVFSMGGKIGVNIFFLISGYFLIESKGITMSKILKFWAQLLFYSVGVFLVFYLSGRFEGMSMGGFAFELFKSCFPVITETWWFASVYFLLYIFSPFINKFLKSLDKGSYRLMLVIMTFFWCIVPTFTVDQFTVQCTALVWAVYMYSMAGYYRLYGLSRNFENKKGSYWIGLALVTILITALTVFVLLLLGTKISFFENRSRHFLHEYSLLLLAIAVFLFLGFQKLKIQSKFINIVAGSTFGIYLIHDDVYFRIVWKTVFHFPDFQDSVLLIPYSIFIVLITFVVCCVIDLLRRYALEPWYLKLLNYMLSPLIGRVKKLADKTAEV